MNSMDIARARAIERAAKAPRRAMRDRIAAWGLAVAIGAYLAWWLDRWVFA